MKKVHYTRLYYCDGIAHVELPICGILFGPKDETWYKSKVTCKRCLKKLSQEKETPHE